MRIKVPAMVDLYPPMMGGMAGLGQDTTDITLPDTFGGGAPVDTSTPGFTGGVDYSTVSTPSGDFQVVGNTVIDPNGNLSSASALQSALGISAPSSGGSAPNLTQILAAAGSAVTAGTKAYLALQQPNLVAGTGLVYNPATGQYVSPSPYGGYYTLGGAPGTAVPIASALGTTAVSMGPLILLGIGALVLIMMMGRH